MAFRRFVNTFDFVNLAGETQRIFRGWSGEVSDAVAKAADDARATPEGQKEAGGSSASPASYKPVAEAEIGKPIESQLQPVQTQAQAQAQSQSSGSTARR